MRTRPLTSEEFQYLKKVFGPPKVKRPVWDFICLSAFISIPLFLLFVSVLILAEKKAALEALQQGLVVLLVGPGFLLIQRIAGGRNPGPHPFAQAHEDMRAGICQIREFRIHRIWPLVDQGNENEPDYLVETDSLKYLAISARSIRTPAPLHRCLEIHELPKSRTTVSITFSGEEISIDSQVIRTDCVWRNDDLPWERPIKATRLPPEAQAVISARGE